MEPSSNPPTVSRFDHSLLKAAFSVYSVMFAAAIILMYFYTNNLSTMVILPAQSTEKFRLLVFAVTGALICIGSSVLIETIFPSYQKVKLDLRLVLGAPTWMQSFWLASLSAVSEEFFFRGAIQPIAGLFATSLIFALLHLSPGGRISIWTWMALLAGLFLGWVTEQCGSIWPAVAIHFLVNIVGILELRKLNLETIARALEKSDTHHA